MGLFKIQSHSFPCQSLLTIGIVNLSCFGPVSSQCEHRPKHSDWSIKLKLHCFGKQVDLCLLIVIIKYVIVPNNHVLKNLNI